MRPFGLAVGLLVALASAAPAQDRSTLARAHLLYNDRQYDAAIAAASTLRLAPYLADAAALVVARAHLERFRESADPADLDAAREALTAIEPDRLSPSDRVAFLVGLGESLYLDDIFGAAADLFESVLARPEWVGPDSRDRVLDWWATALDRLAQIRQGVDRDALYQRILTRMEDELGRDPGSSAAAYWMAAAARGLGDPERAWELAVAGWVRARLASDHGAALRADLDRLMLQGIIPDRVNHVLPPHDPQQAADGLRAEWEVIKQKWSRR